MLTLPEPAVSAIDDERRDLVDGVTGQLVRLKTLLGRVAYQLAADGGDVEHGAYRLLAKLAVGGPARTTALAEALSSDTSTVSRQVSALVKAGFVERRADPADGRACLLAATGEGERVFEHAHRNRLLHLSQMLGRWDVDELRDLVDTLDRFNTDFESYRPVLAADRDRSDSVGPRDHTDEHDAPARTAGHRMNAEGKTVR